MSPLFVLLPGIAGWEVVDVRGGRISQPLISGPLPSAPAAVTDPGDRTPSTINHSRIESQV